MTDNWHERGLTMCRTMKLVAIAIVTTVVVAIAGANAAQASTYESVVLGDGPSSYWRLGESSGSTAVDGSGNGNDCGYSASGVSLGVSGALSGDPDTAAGFGAPGLVECPGSASVVGTQAFSYEVWVKTSSSSGYQYLMAQREAGFGGADGETTLYLDAGYVKFFTWNWSADLSLQSPDPIDDGEWHHVVVTRESDGSAVLYLDGVSVARGRGLTSLISHKVYLGGDGRDSTHYLAGDLDEVAIYPYALTPRQVADHYGIGTTVVTYESVVLGDGPSSYWRLGESSGSTAVDGSGNGNDCGYSASGVSLGVSGALSGDPDTAAGFGAPGLVECPGSASVVGTQAFSYEVWVKTSSSSGYQYLMAQREAGFGGADGETTLYLDAGYVKFFTWNWSADLSLQSPDPIDDGEWHHVVVTRESDGSAVLYLDGVSVARGRGLTSLISHKVYLGGDGRDSTHYLAGDLDEVAIYPYALTPRQVDTHYAVGTARP
jgi:Concanavalin A-like lectin/glucanases superfamily